jgi:carbamoyl-phosphate synthase small subunit
VVFNTAMTGYQEVLTDPSYAGQIVALTCPHIGNYGVNDEDVESRRIFLAALVVRSYEDFYSNWRAAASLGEYLERFGVAGLSGIDTRALTRHIRGRGPCGARLPSAATTRPRCSSGSGRRRSWPGATWSGK